MSKLIEIHVPDIGDYSDVPVIEVLVKVGDMIEKEQSVVTLESDKATMDVPSSHAGVVKEVRVKVGDSISEGALVLVLEASDGATAAAPAANPAPAEIPQAAPMAAAISIPTPIPTVATAPAAQADAADAGNDISHASPTVRKYARELGVQIGRVTGSGPKGRITQEDVQAFVKGVMSGTTPSATQKSSGNMGSLDLLPWPTVDFAKFGSIERQPLSRIKKLSAANLARNWVMIPAVTYHDDADITELEAFRVSTNKENEKQGNKITMLAFMIKAAVYGNDCGCPCRSK
jgi:pyruvate dehydrogenase E2 component (dihydrolipoamide acetyltransferase)